MAVVIEGYSLLDIAGHREGIGAVYYGKRLLPRHGGCSHDGEESAYYKK